MLDLRFAGAVPTSATVAAVAVAERPATEDDRSTSRDDPGRRADGATADRSHVLGDAAGRVDAAELDAFLRDVEHRGKAGSVQTLGPAVQPVARCCWSGSATATRPTGAPPAPPWPARPSARSA